MGESIRGGLMVSICTVNSELRFGVTKPVNQRFPALIYGFDLE